MTRTPGPAGHEQDGDALRRYYAARAREYESIYAKPERQADLRRLEQLLPQMFTGRNVLEVACGTGYWTWFIAHKARNITAVDVSSETLALAAEKSWPAGRVRFAVANACALPAEFGLFDAAFAGFWWSHLRAEERGHFLATLDSRLLPGARVAFLDNRYVEGSSTPISHRDADGNTYQRRRLADGSEHVVLKNFPCERELNADVAAYGRNTRFVELEYYWLYQYEKALSP